MKLRLRLGKGFSVGSSGPRYRGSAGGLTGMIIASLVSLVAVVVIGPFVLIGKLFGRDRR